MATQIQRRRSTTANHAAFTGALGELTYDTDKKVFVAHDGSTPGGFPMLGALGNLADIGYSGRKMDERLGETVYLSDFKDAGPVDPTGATDCSDAFKAARDYIENNSVHRGGIIKLGRGTFRVDETIAFTEYAAEGVHNTWVEGEGQLATHLDFANAPSGSDGLTWGEGAHFGGRDFSLVSAPRDGILIGGDANSASQFCFTRVNTNFCGRDGIRSSNSFHGTVEECEMTLRALDRFKTSAAEQPGQQAPTDVPEAKEGAGIGAGGVLVETVSQKVDELSTQTSGVPGLEWLSTILTAIAVLLVVGGVAWWAYGWWKSRQTDEGDLPDEDEVAATDAAVDEVLA